MVQANSDGDESVENTNLPAGVSRPAEKSVTARLAETFDEYDAKVADAEHAGAAMNAAMDAAEEFAEVVVAADGEDEGKAYRQSKAYLNQLCDAKSALGRKDVRSYWEEQIEIEKQAASIDDELPEVFAELFCECLTGVTKTVLTDKKKDETEYELKFADGRGTSLVVSHSALMSHEKAWKTYTSASGQYPQRITEKFDGSQFTDSDWQNKIGPVIEGLEIVEMEVGPRTAAYRSIENKIERSVAYEDMGDAVEQGGLWVGEVEYNVETDTGDMESRTVEELRVMREDIAQITSQHDVTDRGLQIELKTRGLSSPRVSGISESTYVNGSYQTYWCFVLDEMPDPEDVVDEVDDPMDRLDDQNNDDEDSNGEDDDGDDGEAPADAGDEEDRPDTPVSEDTDNDVDSDDDGYGKMGTFGGDNGGDGQ